MPDKSPFVLAVALLTWGGVFCYLLRLDAAVKNLENELKAQGKKETFPPIAEVPADEKTAAGRS